MAACDPTADDPIADDRRLRAVREAQPLADDAIDGLQRLVQLVARLLGFSQARLNLVDATHQRTVVAFGAPVGEAIPRDQSFCARAILAPDELLVVPDATLDPRFADNPLVTSGLLRAYVGAPLVSSDGSALGALCVTDQVPRTPSPEALGTLRLLADAVSDELDHSRTLLAIAEISHMLALARDVDEVRDRICEVAARATGAETASLLVRDGQRLRTVATTNPAVTGFEASVGDETLSGRVCLTGEPEFHPDHEELPEASRASLTLLGGTAIYAHPVGEAGPDGTLGVLLIAWDGPRAVLPQRIEHTLSVLADEAAVTLERVARLERLEHLSLTDGLTGLANRRAFDQALSVELATAGRNAAPLTVALLDFDHFKAYNDRLGHPAGDRLLKHAAAAWPETVRAGDTIARWGGEEFAFVLPVCTAPSALILLERARSVLGDGQTCSVGVAQWDERETASALVARADRALYRAKRAGRDRIVADGVEGPDR